MRTLVRIPAPRRGRVRATPRQALGVLVAVAVAVAPAVVTWWLIHDRLDTHIRDFVPSFWNDQVGYWHRILSFSRHGLDTGYYAPDEVRPPHFDSVRFGVNGPWFTLVYGTIAAVVGWSAWTSIPVNLAVLAVGLLAFIRLARLDLVRTLLAGAAVLTLWVVLLYVPTASQESLQQAIALVLAGLLVRAVRDGAALSRGERALSVAFVVLVALLRFSWALALIPLLLLYAPAVTPRRVAGAIAAGAAASLVAVELVGIFQPPGQNSVSDRLTGVEHHPLSGTWDLVKLAWQDLTQFLYPGILDPTSPATGARGSLDFTNVQSWVVVGLLGLALAVLVARRPLVGIGRREALVHASNLGLMLLAALLLYVPFGYFRVLGANLLLSLMVLVALRRIGVVAVVIALNLLVAPTFLSAYSRWAPNFAFDQRSLTAQRAGFARLMPYDPHARSPWCNTLLMPVEVYDWRVTLVPAGLGISYSLGGAPLRQPLRSRYVLLPDQPSSLSASVSRTPLRRLGRFPAGTLYLNRRSACPG